MKSLSAIAKELGLSVATVSYVYNNKWRENRIHPELAKRVRRKLADERGAPDALGRQLQSGRTQTVGLLLPHLDQPYFLHLLAGIEQRLGERNHMVLLGIDHSEQQKRQAELAQRMLARHVDALLMCPRPASDLGQLVESVQQNGRQPLVFLDNYLPGTAVPCVLSDNRWGALQAVQKMLEEGRRRILFLGGHSAVAALSDRHQGYCDALQEAGLDRDPALTIWRDAGDESALEIVRRLLCSDDPPDGFFVTSYYRFSPFLTLLSEIGLGHPDEVMLAGFDEPMESWAADVVRTVVRRPLLVVRQAAEQIGRGAVDLALASIDGEVVPAQERLIRPVLSWRCAD